jgi:hypothetical protein
MRKKIPKVEAGTVKKTQEKADPRKLVSGSAFFSKIPITIARIGPTINPPIIAINIAAKPV